MRGVEIQSEAMGHLAPLNPRWKKHEENNQLGQVVTIIQSVIKYSQPFLEQHK